MLRHCRSPTSAAFLLPAALHLVGKVNHKLSSEGVIWITLRESRLDGGCGGPFSKRSGERIQEVRASGGPSCRECGQYRRISGHTRRGRPGKTVVMTRSQSPYEDPTMLGRRGSLVAGTLGSAGLIAFPCVDGYVEVSRPQTSIYGHHFGWPEDPVASTMPVGVGWLNHERRRVLSRSALSSRPCDDESDPGWSANNS